MILSHDWGNGIARKRSRRRRLKLNMLKFPNPPYFFQNIESECYHFPMVTVRSFSNPGDAPPEHALLLATDRMDLSAELIGLIYRYRWQIELFFRWLKCILGCQHLLALSQNGITIQVYCALIASLLIRLWTATIQPNVPSK